VVSSVWPPGVDATDARQVPRTGKKLGPEQSTDYLPRIIIQRFVSRCQGQQNMQKPRRNDRGGSRENYQCRHRHSYIAPVYYWLTGGFDTPDLQKARALLGA
jgi:hypothetical protein